MKGKKLLSAILAGAMVLGTMSFTAFAAETEVNTYEALTAAITQANSGKMVITFADGTGDTGILTSSGFQPGTVRTAV